MSNKPDNLILINEEGQRLDGRRKDQIRPIKIEVGVLSRADGSCYLEWGRNKILVGVYGPREAHPRRMQKADSAVIRYRYNMAAFSVEDRARPGPNRRSTEISKVSREAFEPVIMAECYPKAAIDIFVEVLQADAGTRTAAINAASVALADAGIPMKGLVTSCAFGKVEGQIVLDLDKDEDNFGEADFPVAFTQDGEITLVQMDGHLTPKEIKEGMELVKIGCKEILQIQREALQKKFGPGKESEGPSKEEVGAEVPVVSGGILEKAEAEVFKASSEEADTEEADTEEADTEEADTEEVEAEEADAEEAEAEEVEAEEVDAEEADTEEADAEEVDAEEADAEEADAEEADAEEAEAEEAEAEEAEAEEADAEEADAEEAEAEEADAEEAEAEEAEEAEAEEAEAEEAEAEEAEAEEAEAEEVEAEEVDAEEADTEKVEAEEVDAEEADTEKVEAEFEAEIEAEIEAEFEAEIKAEEAEDIEIEAVNPWELADESPEEKTEIASEAEEKGPWKVVKDPGNSGSGDEDNE